MLFPTQAILMACVCAWAGAEAIKSADAIAPPICVMDSRLPCFQMDGLRTAVQTAQDIGKTSGGGRAEVALPG